MLRAVRGLIVVSLLLGIISSALPHVSAAAFGPMVQVIGTRYRAVRAEGFGHKSRDFR